LGHITLLEIKAGDLKFTDSTITKTYGQSEKNIRHQLNSQYSAWVSGLNDQGLTDVRISHFIVLPDQKVTGGSAAFPRERIIDSGQLESICQIILQSMPSSDTN